MNEHAVLVLTLIDCYSGDIGNMIYENVACQPLGVPLGKLSVDRACIFHFPKAAVSRCKYQKVTVWSKPHIATYF